MTDYGDMCREMREAKQERRAEASIRNSRIMDNSGINYVTRDGGVFRVTDAREDKIDFWAQSGKWRIVGKKGKTMSGGAESFLNWLKKRNERLETSRIGQPAQGGIAKWMS